MQDRLENFAAKAVQGCKSFRKPPLLILADFGGKVEQAALPINTPIGVVVACGRDFGKKHQVRPGVVALAAYADLKDGCECGKCNDLLAIRSLDTSTGQQTFQAFTIVRYPAGGIDIAPRQVHALDFVHAEVRLQAFLKGLSSVDGITVGGLR